MIARLLFQKKAYRKDFNTATAEHHTWREIAEIYNNIHPLRYITVPTEDDLRSTRMDIYISRKEEFGNESNADR